MSDIKNNILSIKDIDTSNDDIVQKMTINFKIRQMTSTNKVTEYKSKKGETYYVFKLIKGSSILNFTKGDYELLTEHLTLNDNITIFFDDEDAFVSVPLAYRY